MEKVEELKAEFFMLNRKFTRNFSLYQIKESELIIKQRTPTIEYFSWVRNSSILSEMSVVPLTKEQKERFNKLAETIEKNQTELSDLGIRYQRIQEEIMRKLEDILTSLKKYYHEQESSFIEMAEKVIDLNSTVLNCLVESNLKKIEVEMFREFFTRQKEG